MSEAPITIELNPRDRRLYDRLRAQVRTPSLEVGSGIGDFLLLLPDLTVLLARLIRDDRVPLGAKAIALLGFGYAISPIDLIPSLVFGPVGLVDDLMVVTAALSRLLNDVHPDVVRSHWAGKGDALEVIQKVTHWSETQVRRTMRAVVGRFVGRGRGV